MRPPQPKYDTTWDPKTVLDFLSKWFPNENLTLEQLSQKLITLLALVTGHRMQTLSLIKINNVKKSDSSITIMISDRIKTSALGRKQPLLTLPYFRKDISICAATTLEAYITRTRDLRYNGESLFISFKRPYKVVSTQTLSRWVKKVLNASGVNTDVFSAHSTRHASTSAAKRKGVNLDLIRKTAGWSKNSATFAKFYDRPVSDDRDQFAMSVLNS